MVVKNQEQQQGWTQRGFVEGELIILTISINISGIYRHVCQPSPAMPGNPTENCCEDGGSQSNWEEC